MKPFIVHMSVKNRTKYLIFKERMESKFSRQYKGVSPFTIAYKWASEVEKLMFKTNPSLEFNLAADRTAWKIQFDRKNGIDVFPAALAILLRYWFFAPRLEEWIHAKGLEPAQIDFMDC